MVQLVTLDSSRGKVSFLFGTEAMILAAEELNIKGMQKFAEVFSDPGFKEVSALLFAGHQNACMEQKKDLVYLDRRDLTKLIDEIGQTKMAELLTIAVTSMTGEGDKKKGGQKKKP